MSKYYIEFYSSLAFMVEAENEDAAIEAAAEEAKAAIKDDIRHSNLVCELQTP